MFRICRTNTGKQPVAFTPKDLLRADYACNEERRGGRCATSRPLCSAWVGFGRKGNIKSITSCILYEKLNFVQIRVPSAHVWSAQLAIIRPREGEESR